MSQGLPLGLTHRGRWAGLLWNARNLGRPESLDWNSHHITLTLILGGCGCPLSKEILLKRYRRASEEAMMVHFCNPSSLGG